MKIGIAFHGEDRMNQHTYRKSNLGSSIVALLLLSTLGTLTAPRYLETLTKPAALLVPELSEACQRTGHRRNFVCVPVVHCHDL
jgi:hypothetical protein